MFVVISLWLEEFASRYVQGCVSRGARLLGFKKGGINQSGFVQSDCAILPVDDYGHRNRPTKLDSRNLVGH